MIDIERVKISQKIREALTAKGVVISELARSHGVTPQAMHNVIDGLRGRTCEDAITVAMGEDLWLKWCGKPSEGSGGV